MANKMELKRINRNIIYRCIYDHRGIARQELAIKTGLSMPTIIQNLNELEDRGLILTDGVFESTGGRRAKVIHCVYRAAYAVGIDITKNHVTIVVMDVSGSIICGGVREEFPFEDTQSYYQAICTKLGLLLEDNQIDREKILGVGISLPSIVDREKNLVLYGKILAEPKDIYQRFQSIIPYRIEIFNDANSGGFAESWHTKTDKMVFYLMLSNSVGGAMIRDNEIYLGDSCRSSEIGHVKIVPGGRKCYCGQEGCVNAYLSAKLLADEAGGLLEDFFEGLERGKYRDIFAEYLDHLANTVTNLRMLFDCDIILGGYVGRFMDQYMQQLGERLGLLNPYETGYDYVKPCRYKIEASAVGAALPFVSEFIDAI